MIQQWEALNTETLATGPGGNTRVGKYHYGVDREKLEVTSDTANQLCQFKTADFDSRIDGGGKAHEFTCFDNIYKETNGAYSPINDMHFYATHFYDMFQSWYQRKPVNNVITNYAHDTLVKANAYWTGNSTHYGDGDDSFFPFTTDDIVAHEIAHGTTEQSSGLVYMHQSGGLNESFSDITGAAFKYHMGYPNYWRVGADVGKRSISGIRYFIRPSLKGQIDNVELYHDDLDVHITSGPFNHAYYILSTQPGWELHKAYDVFVLANTQLWTEETNFDQAALALYEAALELNYGTNDLCYALKKVGQSCGRWPEPGSEPYQLINGETYDELHGDIGSMRYFKIALPFQANNLKVSIFNGEGDADLYVAYGRQPNSEDYDCRPNVSGNNETCFFKHVQAGTYYITIKAHKNYSKLKMKASFVTDKCLKHIHINNLNGDKGSKRYFVYCPEHSPSLVSIHGGRGDVDLYIKKGAKPTLHDFDCRPYELGNDEQCRLEDNASYYIMLHGHQAYADVTLSSHE